MAGHGKFGSYDSLSLRERKLTCCSNLEIKSMAWSLSDNMYLQALWVAFRARHVLRLVDILG